MNLNKKNLAVIILGGLLLSFTVYYITVINKQYVSAASEKITYIGRWAQEEKEHKPTMITINGGTGLRFGFTGTSLMLHFVKPANVSDENMPQIEFAVDNGASQRVPVTGDIVAASKLAAGKHIIEIWVAGVHYGVNNWASHQGVMLQGVSIDTGAELLTCPKTTAGKMLVIGDSIAEGHLVKGYEPGEVITRPQYSDGRNVFGNQLARLLNYDCWIVAFAGSGFYGPESKGGVPATHENYLEMMQGVPQYDPAFDLVIIEAGNNDFRTSAEVFETNYALLIDRVRQYNPHARLLLMGPLDGYATQHRPIIQKLANQKNAYYVDTSTWNVPSPNFNHPNLEGQTIIANHLFQVLKK